MLNEDDAATLRHARIFLTSREKIHPVGLEQWDEMVERLSNSMKLYSSPPDKCFCGNPPEEVMKSFARSRAISQDGVMFDRAMCILHRLATERTGWRGFFARWYYSDEPLRNDAANLVREAGFMIPMPNTTRLVGDQT